MIIIEKLRKAHFESLSEMALELWPDCDINAEKVYWDKVINSEDQYLALAKVGDDFIGFINISTRTDHVEGSDTSPVAYLEAIYVKNGFRQKDVASLLLSHGETWAKSRGLTQLASDTEVTNQLSQLFHLKAGFQEINRIVCYLKNI